MIQAPLEVYRIDMKYIRNLKIPHKGKNKGKVQITYEGTLRDYFYMNGEYVGRLYFSILRSEFQTMI